MISFAPALIHSQPLAAFSDYRNYFYVWDNGQTTRLEIYPVSDIMAGKNYVTYTDNTGSLKIYNNRKVINAGSFQNAQFYPTDNYFLFTFGGILKIFDNGKTTNLSMDAGLWSANDSTVAFVDNQLDLFRVYTNGKIKDLEEGLMQYPVRSFKTGENILAYMDAQQYFKIYYRDSLYVIDRWSEKTFFNCGQDMVAFNDPDENNFQLFYKGNLYKMEDEKAGYSSAGDGILAYSYQRNFKVYYNGKIAGLLPFLPDFYHVKDSLIIYSEHGLFKCYYAGNTYILDDVVPSLYKYDEASILWIDRSGYLKSFFRGKIQTITVDKISSWNLYGNIIVYTNPANENVIIANH